MTSQLANESRGRTVGDRESTAVRLIQSSVERSYDPDIDIDWTAPIDADLDFHPETLISIYGTDLWDALTEDQRRQLARLEIGWTSSQGIMAEIGLMTMLLRVAAADPTSKHAQYALTELADECRHSVMFSRSVAKYRQPGDPTVPPLPPRVATVLRFVGVLMPNSAAGWSGLLYVEDTLDKMQRETMRDPRIQPLIRMVNKIHVLEEARHMTYAREELVRSVENGRRLGLAVNRYLIALSALVSSRFVLPPALYAEVGLDGAEAHRVAIENPHRIANLRRHAERYTALLDELGLLRGRRTMELWRRSGLLGS